MWIKEFIKIFGWFPQTELLSRTPHTHAMRIAVARTIGALLLGVLRMGTVAGNHAQLIMERTFTIETSTCEGLACRKQLVGGAEAHGLSAHSMCTNRVQYVHDINAAGETQKQLRIL